MKAKITCFSHIEPILLEHLAKRAHHEWFNYFPPYDYTPWNYLPDVYKEAWKVAAATILNEINNVLREGIKQKDQR